MYLKFRMNDIILFHKIVYGTSVLSFPAYIISARSLDSDGTRRHFIRETRQFNSNDTLKYKCTVLCRIDAFSNSFFPRTLFYWNALPLSLREIECEDLFKTKLKEHLWLIATEDLGLT